MLYFNLNDITQRKGGDISIPFHPIDNAISPNGNKSLINQEDARNLCQVGRMAFPLLHGAGMDVFVLASDVGGNAKPGLGTTILQNIFHHFIIAVRRFDEDCSVR